MQQNPLSDKKLNDLKRLFLGQLDYIQQNVPAFTHVRIEALDWLREKTKQVDTLDALGALLMFPVPNRDMGMKLLHQTSSVHPIESTCFPFGTGSFGWYTLRCQSDCGRVGFVLFLCRIEVACPLVLQKFHGPDCVTDGTFYYCTGTVFSLSDSDPNRSLSPQSSSIVRVLPECFLFGEYTSFGSNAFRLRAFRTEFNHGGGGGGLFSVELESRRNGEIHVSCQWDEGILFATLSQNTLPFYDGPHEGHPTVDHVGQLRWSMTHMQASFSIHFPNTRHNVHSAVAGTHHKKERDESCRGMAWMSHHWQRGQPSPKGLYRFWNNVFRRVGTPARHRMHLRLYIQLCHEHGSSSVEQPQYIVHAHIKNPTAGFAVGQTLLCSVYKFHSNHPPLFEHKHPFAVCVRAVADTRNGSVPSELEVVESGDFHVCVLPVFFFDFFFVLQVHVCVLFVLLQIPKFTLIRTAHFDGSGGSAHPNANSTIVSGMEHNHQDWTLHMPTRAQVLVIPGTVVKTTFNDDVDQAKQNLVSFVEQRIGFSWMEITNVGLQHHETFATYDEERIRLLRKQMEGDKQKNHAFHPNEEREFEHDVDLWKNSQDDVPVWYTVFFVLFLVLSVVCASMFVLIPFTDTPKKNKPK